VQPSVETMSTDASPMLPDSGRPRVVLICHHDAPLDTEGIRRWLGSFTDLVGVVVIKETGDQVKRRVQRELKRVGPVRFADVLAFRLYYKLALAKGDAKWTSEELARLTARFPAVDVPVIETRSPNTAEAETFIRAARADIIIARSKFMLNKRIFTLAKRATLVMHPGVCPEYRNAHGCFWALANDDRTRVGLTLLAIDEGIDTGPVYGTYSYGFDERAETHHRIQQRCLFENLDAIGDKLLEIHKGTAERIDTSGRQSAVWGQPWLTRHLAWKRRAWKRTAGRGAR
jgi:folate-dependent phosphoribosylglycinamide formyltransferase PurN